MRVVIPNGLAGLLQKLGVAGGKPGEGAATAKGMAGQEPAGPQKGEALGDGTLLVGLGYNPADKGGVKKNVAEKDNVARFLKDPGAEVEKLLARGEVKEAKDAKEAKEAAERPGPANEAARERAEAREAPRQEARREERPDETRLPQKEQAQETREPREAEREKERERERQRDQQQGQGHGQPEPEPERALDETDGGPGAIHEGEALAESTRCRGTLEDGSRCLRKPRPGTPYCLEHAAPPVASGIPGL